MRALLDPGGRNGNSTVEVAAQSVADSPEKQANSPGKPAPATRASASADEPENPKHSDLTGKLAPLAGFKGPGRAAIAAAVRRRGGVLAHTAEASDRAIVQGQEIAASLREQSIPIVEPESADPRTALECLADLIQADDEEFGVEAVDGEYRVRRSVTECRGLDCLTVHDDGRIHAALNQGDPCDRTLTEDEALEVLVLGGHRSSHAGRRALSAGGAR